MVQISETTNNFIMNKISEIPNDFSVFGFKFPVENIETYRISKTENNPEYVLVEFTCSKGDTHGIPIQVSKVTVSQDDFIEWFNEMVNTVKIQKKYE